MRQLSVITIAVLLAVSLPTVAEGQTDIKIGPRLGIDGGDIEEPFIGADARIELEATRLTINPTFDFFFTDDPLNLWSLSTNALYRFGIDNQVFTPYAGAGLGIYRFSIDDAGGSTDLGLNTIFGAEFHMGSVRPFLEAQYSPVFTNGDTTNLFTVKGGLLFTL